VRAGLGPPGALSAPIIDVDIDIDIDDRVNRRSKIEDYRSQIKDHVTDHRSQI